MYLLGECFQSIAVEMYSPLVCSVLHAAVWRRRPATNISQLYLHLGKLTVFQAPLQGASSNVPSRACSAYEHHVCVFDFSTYHTDLSRHHFTALSHIHKRSQATTLIHANTDGCMPQSSLPWLLRHTEQLPVLSVLWVGLEFESTAIRVFLFQGSWWKWGLVLERRCAALKQQESCQSQTEMGCSYPQPVRELFISATANQTNWPF